MTDVVLSNDDITVLGPPSTIELSVDIGPQGDRGSQIFVGVGDPNTITIGQPVELNDIYINTSPGADYGYMYQYRSEPGGNVWVETLKISPTIYSKNILTTYTNGVAEIIVPINDIVIVSGAPLEASNFNVQYSISHTNPIASSMSIPALTSGENLVIDFKAVQSTSGTWSNLSGEVITHIFISIVI
jgi:hypothetical protein